MHLHSSSRPILEVYLLLKMINYLFALTDITTCILIFSSLRSKLYSGS